MEMNGNDIIPYIEPVYRFCVKRLTNRHDDQINQYVCGYIHNIIGFVPEELIKRGVPEKPDAEKPLVNGVFSIGGKYVNV